MITQADREAAASYWKSSHIGKTTTWRKYEDGRADDSRIVQAFAAHRIAAENAQRERDAAIALKHCVGAFEDEYWQAAVDVAKAIRDQSND
jgi:hypothetical protein